MTNLNEYMKDGAHHSAKAVLAFLQAHDGIEESWDDEQKRYSAEPKVARWENGREQGYVISMRSKNYSRQLNIAFFEHRNSDNISAIKWEQNTTNSPTIQSADFKGQVYKDKWDTSKDVSYGEVTEMEKWIWKQLTEFWTITESEKVAPINN